MKRYLRFCHLLFASLVILYFSKTCDGQWCILCQWSNWEGWSRCSGPCGGGSRRRKRNICCLPYPADWGNWCIGKCQRSHQPWQQHQGCTPYCYNGGRFYNGRCNCPDKYYSSSTCCRSVCPRISHCSKRSCNYGMDVYCKTCQEQETTKSQSVYWPNEDKRQCLLNTNDEQLETPGETPGVESEHNSVNTNDEQLETPGETPGVESEHNSVVPAEKSIATVVEDTSENVLTSTAKNVNTNDEQLETPGETPGVESEHNSGFYIGAGLGILLLAILVTAVFVILKRKKKIYFRKQHVVWFTGSPEDSSYDSVTQDQSLPYTSMAKLTQPSALGNPTYETLERRNDTAQHYMSVNCNGKAVAPKTPTYESLALGSDNAQAYMSLSCVGKTAAPKAPTYEILTLENNKAQ